MVVQPQQEVIHSQQEKDPPKSKAPPATLEERQEVLLYCLNTTKRKAARFARLLSPLMDAEDIQSEVGIKIWRAMIKKDYLKKTKADLIKIGYVTAHRHISQLVRSRLSYRSRGAYSVTIPFHAPHVNTTVSLLLGKNYNDMSVMSKVLLFETIRNEAIGLVGLGRYKFLLRAVSFDWLVEDLNPTQCAILVRLDYSQPSMMRAISLLSARVMRKVCPEEDTDVQPSKINGVWVQNTEAPRRAIV